METDRFVITRADGRSNADVLIDLIKDAQPGQVFTYTEIGEALSVGCDRQYDVNLTRSAVLQALHRLEKEHQRTLRNIRAVGYKVAKASEHMEVGMLRKRKADTQLRKGLHTLRHVRWNEMDDNTRTAHQGHLMVTEALYANQRGIERRLQAVEQAIAKAMPQPELVTT